MYHTIIIMQKSLPEDQLPAVVGLDKKEAISEREVLNNEKRSKCTKEPRIDQNENISSVKKSMEVEFKPNNSNRKKYSYH